MELTFAPVLSGALAIGHRPPLRKMRAMKEAGVTHVVTVLSETESPHAIGAAARHAGLEWVWIELGSTKSLPSVRRADLAAALTDMAAILSGGGRLYLHCSAGIHRTGMVAAALLFFVGEEETKVRKTLTVLRSVTAEDMGAERFEWARAAARTARGAD